MDYRECRIGRTFVARIREGESIYKEMTETRDFLSRVEFAEPKKEDDAETPPSDDEEEEEAKVVSPEERAQRALARRVAETPGVTALADFVRGNGAVSRGKVCFSAMLPASVNESPMKTRSGDAGGAVLRNPSASVRKTTWRA